MSNALGSFAQVTDNGAIVAKTAPISASTIEIIIGSDDKKNKGGGTVTLFYRQHPTAEWATVKQFTEADAIEDFKANSTFVGEYAIELTGATSPDLQVSWRI